MPTPPKPSAKDAAPQKITAWSFSRRNDYKKCPAFAKFKHVLRIAEPGNDAMTRGAAIGEMANKFAKARKTTKCPPQLQTFEQEFRELQKKVVMAEEEWCFTSAWKRTGWFDKDAWCRVKVDACFVDGKARRAKVIDYKTGKVREEHEEQLDLYALAAFIVLENEVDEVEVELWYLDQGVQKPDEPRVYLRDEVPALKKKWEKDVAPMLRDTRFQPKPSKACTWCFYRAANKGPCKY